MRSISCIVIPLLVAPAIAADELAYSMPEGKTVAARCVGVSDGDTITLLVESKAGNRQVKIRLDAIDAPEIGQPFGRQAKRTLSEMVYGKDCHVESMGEDKYGRTIGRITVDGKNVNLAMLEAGMAWHYKKYDQRAELANQENSAREVRVGLWADASAIPPWHWRKMSKSEREEFRKDTCEEAFP
jgi:micrococcal nuclease